MKLAIATLVLFASFNSFASDGAGADTANTSVLEFLAQPAVKGKSDTGSYDNRTIGAVSGLYDDEAIRFFYTEQKAKGAKLMTCAQAKRQSRYSGQCGYGYVSHPAYVKTKDVKHCFIGYDCYPQDSSSNN